MNEEPKYLRSYVCSPSPTHPAAGTKRGNLPSLCSPIGHQVSLVMGILLGLIRLMGTKMKFKVSNLFFSTSAEGGVNNLLIQLFFFLRTNIIFWLILLCSYCKALAFLNYHIYNICASEY